MSCIRLMRYSLGHLRRRGPLLPFTPRADADLTSEPLLPPTPREAKASQSLQSKSPMPLGILCVHHAAPYSSASPRTRRSHRQYCPRVETGPGNNLNPGTCLTPYLRHSQWSGHDAWLPTSLLLPSFFLRMPFYLQMSSSTPSTNFLLAHPTPPQHRRLPSLQPYNLHVHCTLQCTLPEARY